MLGCESEQTEVQLYVPQTAHSTLDSQEVLVFEQPLPTYVLPNEIEVFGQEYHNYIHKWQGKIHTKLNSKQQAQRKKEAAELDLAFVRLRREYRYDESALKALGEFSCLLPDCSAAREGNIYFYPHRDIIEAYRSILADKNTEIFGYLDIMNQYSYVLVEKQTTSIDLQVQYINSSRPMPFQTLKFVWHDSDILEVVLMPKEEICKPYIYLYRTIFQQDSNGVRVERLEERLSAFTYPSDLVDFVARSCSCARANGFIPKLSFEEEKVAKNALAPSKEYCPALEGERKELWDKYMHDTRIIGILQHEQKLYPNDYDWQGDGE